MEGMTLGAFGGLVVFGLLMGWEWLKDKLGPRPTFNDLLDPRFRR